MKLIYIIALSSLIFLSGCSVKLGLAAHSYKKDSPEIRLSNMLGVVSLEKEYKEHNFTTYCQHISGVDTDEKGAGLNMCGFNVEIK